MVMLKVTSLVLLFLVTPRFTVDKSIAYVLQPIYRNLFKILEGLKRMVLCYELDLLFLEACLENQVIPKCLNFQVSKLHLITSRAYHACQRKLLRDEISFKQSTTKVLKKYFNTRKKKVKRNIRYC